MRAEIQMQHIRNAITAYSGDVPLATYLKQFFREHKEMGSRDRRFYSSVIFTYFRLKGNRPHNERIIVDAAQKTDDAEVFFAYWDPRMEKVEKDGQHFFPVQDSISAALDVPMLLQAMEKRPCTWIRCSAGRKKEVIAAFQKAGLVFEVHGNAISMDMHYPLQEMELFADGAFEIQDIASQQVVELCKPKKNESWWDCCAGSGGKSLLLLEEEKQILLFVSDNRDSILRNLQERFLRHDVVNYNTVPLDIETANEKQWNRIPVFDHILADVPCSGSGTWARTPEWLHFFTKEKLEYYVRKQRKIIQNIVPKVQTGGTIIYITCSVYTDENEGNISWMEQNLSVKCMEKKYFAYADRGGDILFGAVLQKK
ncbi:MAG: hypothetical protein R2794_12015 [Chitinophagales bacterium]